MIPLNWYLMAITPTTAPLMRMRREVATDSQTMTTYSGTFS
jgi:hypothetical protein